MKTEFTYGDPDLDADTGPLTGSLTKREQAITNTIQHVAPWWEGDDNRQVLRGCFRMEAQKEFGGYRAYYRNTLWDDMDRRVHRSSRLYPSMESAKRMAVRAAIEKALRYRGASLTDTTCDWDDEIARGFFGAGS